MATSTSTSARPLLLLLLAVGVGVAAYVTLQEQKSRAASQEVYEKLTTLVDASESATPEVVHTLLGRQPDASRQPGPHKMVEEYHWTGQLGGGQTVYAYYRTGSLALLEAVSINRKIDEWESEQDQQPTRSVR